MRFFANISHRWLVQNIPIDKVILEKFLNSGTIKDDEFFRDIRGISFCSPLSPILGNMTLDGMQSFIYDRLYPNGSTDYQDGCLTRFADDFVITARSRKQAEKIQDIVRVFLAERGLKFSEKKTYITSVNDGFTFLSYHYQEKNGVLVVKPSDKAVIEMEYTLKVPHYRL